MNVLSLISFFNAYSFIILGIYILRRNRREPQNIMASLVNFCFAFWSFTYAFVYPAKSADIAMFWHKTGSIGWILFCVFAAHFFLLLTKRTEKWKGMKQYFLLYILPSVLLIRTLFGNGTPVAESFVQSKMGLGWTYNLNIKSVWFYVYILYILVYFSVALLYAYVWSKKSNKDRLLKQARSITILDIIMIITGIFTEFVIPIIFPGIPPLFNLISILWGIGFFHIVRVFKLINVYDAASPDLILKTVMDPIIMLDRNGNIMTCNHATAVLFKCSLKQIINKPLSDFYKSKKYDKKRLELLIREKSLQNVEIDLVDSEKNIINAIVSFSLAESKLDGAVGIVVSIHDITKQKKIEEELYKRKEKYKELSKSLDKLANYDKLTDIPNRRLFFDQLELSVENYKTSGQEFAIAFIDLDGFKAINDLYGHDIGDKVLINISKTLSSSIRKQDVIARVGGDEFVIIFNNLKDKPGIDDITNRMKQMYFKPIVIDNIICPIGISFGISECPKDGTTIDELMKSADKRMYEDKGLKKTK